MVHGGSGGALSILAALAVMMFAGCTDEGTGTDTPLVPEAAQLQAGMGAIQGLIVDDRFRPLHLTPDPQTEFAHDGFILLHETGQELRSDENGQFIAVDIEPGRYTLRPSVAGHEGQPVPVVVEAGAFAEVSVVVRRIVSPGEDTVIVRDDTLLKTCSVQFLDARYTPGKLCFGDLSADGTTSWVEYNFTGLGNVSVVVIEMVYSQVGDWETWITPPSNLVGAMYGRPVAWDTDYMRAQIRANETLGNFATLPFEPEHFYVWPNKGELGHEETEPILGLGLGFGFTFQYTVRVVTSAFLAEPVDIDAYALLR